MLLGPLREFERVAVLALHAHVECGQPVLELHAGQRVGQGAPAGHFETDLFDQSFGARHDARFPIPVAVEKDSGVVEHDVGAVSDGGEVHRRGGGCVDDERKAQLLREGPRRTQIDEASRLQHRRFHEQRPRGALEPPTPAAGFARVDVRHLDAQCWQLLLEELTRFWAQPLGGQQVVARTQQRQRRARDGGTTTGQHERRLSAFEVGQTAMQQLGHAM